MNLVTVIFFDQVGKPYKYRNIKNFAEGQEFKNPGFLDFAKSSGAIVLNVYDKKTGIFIIQKKLY